MTDAKNQTTPGRLRDVITDFEYFWAWLDGEWNLCRKGGYGIFETMDEAGIDYLDHLEAPAIGVETPEALQDLYGITDQPLPEDGEIAAAHPVRSGRDDLYAEAMRLVGARHTKAGLVELVTWLLLKAENRN